MNCKEYQKLIVESIKNINDKETLELILEILKRISEWGNCMSVKIKISYEDKKELLDVIKRMRPVIREYKIPKNQRGQFKKAYLILKEIE